jgi:hypothetical protein
MAWQEIIPVRKAVGRSLVRFRTSASGGASLSITAAVAALLGWHKDSSPSSPWGRTPTRPGARAAMSPRRDASLSQLPGPCAPAPFARS